MEVVEETMRANDHFPIVRSQCDKRPGPSLPLDSISSVGGTSSGGQGNDGSSSSAALSSTTELLSNTEEQEDMADCLILLAQGRNKKNKRKLNRQKFVERREGMDSMYECKTCSRSFPSFQALGGHRTSHKKFKPMTDEEMKCIDERNFSRNNIISDQTLVRRADNHLMARNNKSKVHECSICGSEFSCGQALGGHMRRHRNIIASMAMNKKGKNDQKSRNVLGFDLNLPAPEEEAVSAPKQPPLFCAPALVNCHKLV